jgi:hypothetical protein
MHAVRKEVFGIAENMNVLIIIIVVSCYTLMKGNWDMRHLFYSEQLVNNSTR